MSADRPIVSPRRWRVRLILVSAAAVFVPGAAALLYAVPPGPGTFYPGCVFFLLTGLHCPGCGGTRCASALVHGDVPQALAYNPLLVICLPLVALLAVSVFYREWTGRRLALPRCPDWAGHLIFWVIVAYWVLRNVPVYPLTLLAPHTL